MDIRKVEYQELQDVLDLIDEFDRIKSARPNQDKLDLIYKQLLASGGCVLGAFDGKHLVGTCTLNICPNFSWTGRPYAIIENVIVTKKMRGQGIGKQLLKEAQAIAENLGCYKVALMTGSTRPETHKFYESAGFSGSKTGFQIRFNSEGTNR